MAYITTAELQSALPKYSISDSTNPNLQDAQRVIDQISARIDGVVAGLGFTIPVTGTASLALLKAICTTGASYRMVRIMFPQARDGLVEELYREWTQDIADLRSGALTLPDAPTSPASVIMSNTSVNATGATAQQAPYITRDECF